MNTKQFLEKITENWPTKVICFFLALFIFFFHRMSVLERRTFSSVPLTVIANGSMVPAAEGTKYVSVTIRGKREELASVSRNDITAYIDISNETREGEMEFPVLIQTSAGIQLLEPLEIRVTPEKIPLTISARTIRYVPLEPLFSGEVAHGYEKTEVSVVPSTIKVEGPREMVESLTAITTGAVDIDKITETTTRDVLPENENRLVTVDPLTHITVTVNVQESVISKDFTGVEIKTKNVADDMEIAPISQTLGFTLEGKQLALEALDDKKFDVYVNCAKITDPGTYEIPVVVTVPAEMKLITVSAQKIKVTATQKPAERHAVDPHPATINYYTQPE